MQDIFPCVQFIVSTQSASVIGAVRKENLLVLTDSFEAYTPSEEVYGCAANTALCRIMGANERIPAVKRVIQAFYDAIDQGQLERARSILEDLEARIGFEDPELIATRITLDLEEM